MEAQAFVGKGLLSFCLRCLACEDLPLRALAYEAVALFSDLVSSSKSASQPHFRYLLLQLGCFLVSQQRLLQPAYTLIEACKVTPVCMVSTPVHSLFGEAIPAMPQLR